MSWFPVEKSEGDESWRQWEPSRKRACRKKEDADNLETAMKAAVQEALRYTMTTTGDAHAATSQPRMLGTKEIDKESTKDPALKEPKQLVEGRAGDDPGHWPRTLIAYHLKHAYYTVVNYTVLNDGKAVIKTGMRSQMLAALHRSDGGIKGMRSRAKDTMFWPRMNSGIQRFQDKCVAFRQTAPSQEATPPKPQAVPDYPLQIMSSD